MSMTYPDSYPLTTERDDDGSYVVSDDVTFAYGWGATLDEAMKDYEESLAELRVLEATEKFRRRAEGMEIKRRG